MTPSLAVLLSLQARNRFDRDLRDRFDGWMRRWGYRTRFTADAEEAVSWLAREDFAASFLDSEMERGRGEAIWRLVRPTVARRVVLMARERDRDLWFEALRSGVATVLPLPARESMVRAALDAVAGIPPARARVAGRSRPVGPPTSKD